MKTKYRQFFLSHPVRQLPYVSNVLILSYWKLPDPAALVFSYNNVFFHARSPFSEISEFPPYQQSRQTRVLGSVAQDAIASYAKSPIDQTYYPKHRQALAGILGARCGYCFAIYDHSSVCIGYLCNIINFRIRTLRHLGAVMQPLL